jgi:hypothetical protein
MIKRGDFHRWRDSRAGGHFLGAHIAAPGRRDAIAVERPNQLHNCAGRSSMKRFVEQFIQVTSGSIRSGAGSS